MELPALVEALLHSRLPKTQCLQTMPANSFDWQPVLLSLEVASAALVLSLVIGVLLAHCFASRRVRGQVFWEAVLLLPLVLPPVVTGYALLVFLGRNGILGAWLTERNTRVLFTPVAAILASFVVALPLMFTSAKAAFQNLDSHWLEAARCLGASAPRVFWTIEIPLAWRGLVAGGVLAFARALGEFGATIMVAGNIAGQTTTAPVAIYMAVEGGQWQVARNYVLILAAMNFAFLIFVNLWLASTRKTAL
jgi:molybdate transport system permease protein